MLDFNIRNYSIVNNITIGKVNIVKITNNLNLNLNNLMLYNLIKKSDLPKNFKLKPIFKENDWYIIFKITKPYNNEIIIENIKEVDKIDEDIEKEKKESDIDKELLDINKELVEINEVEIDKDNEVKFDNETNYPIKLVFDHNYRIIDNSMIKIGSSFLNKREYIIFNIEDYSNYDIVPELHGKKIYFKIERSANRLTLTRLDKKSGWNIKLRLVFFKKPIKINITPIKNFFYTTKTIKNVKDTVYDIINHNNNVTPQYKNYIYDDDMCIDFIEKHFGSKEMYCFHKLKPGAFKADLFRLCVLYINGGVYLDIGMKIVNPIDKLISNYSLVIVNERNKDGIFNAFMCASKGHIFLKEAINGIFDNVKNDFYGVTPHDVTGPDFLKKYYYLIGEDCLELRLSNNMLIYYYNTVYIKYLKDIIKLEHNLYRNMWVGRDIYNDHIKYIYFDNTNINNTIEISGADPILNFINIYYDIADDFKQRIWLKRKQHNFIFDVIIDECIKIIRLDKCEGWSHKLNLVYNSLDLTNDEWIEIKLSK